MKKRTKIILAAVAVLIVMLIPVSAKPTAEGYSVSKAILYSVTYNHTMHPELDTCYDEIIEVKIFPFNWIESA